jgi:hypothetical protein
MNKAVTQIREINKIEDELNSAYAGVLSFNTTEEKLVQISCTFLYYHKNIYAVLNETDDIKEKIIFDVSAGFTVLRSEKGKNGKGSFYSYKMISVGLTGILKRPEEVKITDEIKDLYYQKYSAQKPLSDEEESITFLMLDTSEIKAFEEVGG